MCDSLHSWDWKEIPLWMLCGQLLCHGGPGEAIFFRLENSRKDNRWSSSSFRHYQCKERIWVFGDFSCVCLCVCFLSWPLSFYETGGLKGNGKGWNSDGESQRNAKRRMMKWQSPVKSTKGTYMTDMRLMWFSMAVHTQAWRTASFPQGNSPGLAGHSLGKETTGQGGTGWISLPPTPKAAEKPFSLAHSHFCLTDSPQSPKCGLSISLFR